ncbi:MAG: HDOD domain-containing protein [Oleiphilaceae bacterium]|nr:HDOD domain-containing protein [Oleiphilaceae bacterium]
MSELGQKIKADILEAIENDSLVLPTLPEIALNVREITEDENSGLMDLIEVINKDTALSARILKVSNSPLFRGANEISNLNMAVNRLGMQYTSSLAMGLAMEQMFQATSEMIDVRMRDTWKRSTEVAGVCNVLARKHSHLAPGQATLAGLVHSIGALPILKYVEDNDVAINSIMLDNLLDELQPVVGTKILEHWDFPKELRNVPAECVNFSRTVQRADYADLVMVGLLQSYQGTNHHYTEMDWHHISAFERVGVNPDAEADEDEDLTAEMEAAMALLNV